jgi:hypothetical protein
MVKNGERQRYSPDLVKFDEHDPEDPINWPGRKKKSLVAILCLLSFIS